MANFALIGAAGFVAKRHLGAMYGDGHELVIAHDVHDSVGILDSYFPQSVFVTEPTTFAELLAANSHAATSDRIQYCVICSPTYMHKEHIEMVLRSGIDAICEKPPAMNVEELESIHRLEQQTGSRAFTVLQLRYHPHLVALRETLKSEAHGVRHQVVLRYITPRGRWYDASWKADPTKSGGIILNIGVHLFDILLWLFGEVSSVEVTLSDRRRLAGVSHHQKADVSWLLSLSADDLPGTSSAGIPHPNRMLTIDGNRFDFSETSHLHTAVYRDIIGGGGIPTTATRPAIDLCDSIRRLSR